MIKSGLLQDNPIEIDENGEENKWHRMCSASAIKCDLASTSNFSTRSVESLARVRRRVHKRVRKRVPLAGPWSRGIEQRSTPVN